MMLHYNIPDGWIAAVSSAIRLLGRQRGRALVPRGRGDRRHQRAHRRRQLDGGSGGRHRAPRHVPRLFRAHAARLNPLPPPHRSVVSTSAHAGCKNCCICNRISPSRIGQGFFTPCRFRTVSRIGD